METKPIFHAVAKKENGVLVTYDIYVNNNLFLTSPIKLKRQQAYAIVNLLNTEVDGTLAWAQKFDDPYK